MPSVRHAAAVLAVAALVAPVTAGGITRIIEVGPDTIGWSNAAGSTSLVSNGFAGGQDSLRASGDGKNQFYLTGASIFGGSPVTIGDIASTGNLACIGGQYTNGAKGSRVDIEPLGAHLPLETAGSGHTFGLVTPPSVAKQGRIIGTVVLEGVLPRLAARGVSLTDIQASFGSEDAPLILPSDSPHAHASTPFSRCLSASP